MMPKSMPPFDEWSRATEIHERLRKLSGAQFEKLGYALLMKEGLRDPESRVVIPGGLTFVRNLTPRKGPVDALVASEKQIVVAAFGATSDTHAWEKKLETDCEKIRRALRTAGVSGAKMIFMTTVELQPAQILAAQERNKDSSVITSIEIRPLQAISHQLDVVDVDIADRLLHVPVSLQRFVRLTGGCAEGRPDLPLPAPEDFQAGLVCLPELHRASLHTFIDGMQRCVLLGRHGSGKSWMAAAFARWAEEKLGRTAYYVDARRSSGGDARDWFREAVILNDSRPLLIIDNGHAAREEVVEFVNQFDASEQRVPGIAVMLLLTTPDVPTPRKVWADPITSWETRYAVTIRAEDVWRPMVAAYDHFLLGLDAQRYKATDFDADADGTLAQRHSYDLAASRARLDAWRETGGQLISVSNEAFYTFLYDRYIRPAPDLMRILSAAWIYEVAAHRRAVDEAAAKGLIKDVLVVEEDSSLYGACFRPACHPTLAREALRALIRRDNPDALQSLRGETAYIVAALQDYLLSKPLNAARLMRAIHGAGDVTVLDALFTNEHLVTLGLVSLDEWPATDVPIFLTALARQDPDRAKNEAKRLRRDSARFSSFLSRLQTAPLQDLSLALSLLRRVDEVLTTDVVRSLDADALAPRLQQATLQTVGQVLNMLIREKYPPARLGKVFSSLDWATTTIHEFEGTLQSLAWLARSLDRLGGAKKGDPEGPGQELLRKLGGARLAAAWRRRPVAGVLELFFLVTARDVRKLLMDQLSDEEVGGLLDGDLKDLANLMHWAPILRRGFDTLRDSGRLANRLRAAGAAEIGVCLHVCRQPYNSPEVARLILAEVVAAGSHERFLTEDLLAMALLLYHASAIDAKQAAVLARPLENEGLTRAALGQSTLNGIQLLLHNLAQLRDVSDTPSAAEACLVNKLAEVDLSSAVDSAPLRILHYFVDNMHAYVGQSFARRYVPALRMRLESAVSVAPFDDISRVLWTLVKIEADTEFFTALLQGLRTRLESALQEESGVLLPIVGSVEILTPGVAHEWSLPQADEALLRQAVEAPLRRREPQPMRASLVLVGAAVILGRERTRNCWTPAERRQLDTDLQMQAGQSLARPAHDALNAARSVLGLAPVHPHG